MPQYSSTIIAASDIPVTIRANPIKYHPIEGRRLWSGTIAGLERNGVVADGLGEKVGIKFVLKLYI
jgi:hypothetical protein